MILEPVAEANQVSACDPGGQHVLFLRRIQEGYHSGNLWLQSGWQLPVAGGIVQTSGKLASLIAVKNKRIIYRCLEHCGTAGFYPRTEYLPVGNGYKEEECA